MALKTVRALLIFIGCLVNAWANVVPVPIADEESGEVCFLQCSSLILYLRADQCHTSPWTPSITFHTFLLVLSGANVLLWCLLRAYFCGAVSFQPASSAVGPLSSLSSTSIRLSVIAVYVFLEVVGRRQLFKVRVASR